MLLDELAQVLFVDEAKTALELAFALHEDLVGPVDHDLRSLSGRSGRVNRPVAEDVVGRPDTSSARSAGSTGTFSLASAA